MRQSLQWTLLAMNVLPVTPWFIDQRYVENFRQPRLSPIIARGSVNDANSMEELKRAVGGGLGKHGQKEKRTKVNKYANAVKAPPVDPMEETVAASKKYAEEQEAIRRRKFGRFEDDDEDEDDEMDDYDAEEEAAQEAAYLAEEEARYLAERGEGEDDDELDEKEAAQARAEAARAARQEAQKGRNKKSFPDNAKIDPYDPTTFGFTYLGAVLGAHGLGGELKVRVLSDFGVERFRKGAKLHLKDPQRRFPKEYKVIGGRSAGSGPSNDAWLVKLSGVRTREEAAKLQGSTLFVWRDDRSQALASGEFLVEDLVGLKAMRASPGENEGVVVGTVAGVVTRDEVCILDDTSLGHDLLEIAVPGGRNRGAPRTCLVPLVPALVAAVDIERGCLWLDDGDSKGEVLEGLLELAVEPRDKTRIRAIIPEFAQSLQTAAPSGASNGA